MISGDKGPAIILLHGHFGCADMYRPLMNDLKGSYQVVALDQQGHGYSQWGDSYSRESYIEDLKQLYIHLGLEKSIIIGHSLGAVNAYQLAAREPKLVEKLAIEDIGTRIQGDLSFIREWPEYFGTLRECYDFLLSENINNYLYFMESLTRCEQGWCFRFDKDGLPKSQDHLNGNWIEEWKKVKCNILLMRGTESDVLSSDHAENISKLGQSVEYKEFQGCGHTIRDYDYISYRNTILDFLSS